MPDMPIDQISEGLTFSFGERHNARVSRTLSVVQDSGEAYEEARARTVAQVRKEIADGVDFWMMRCGSPPEFYEGEAWCVCRDYANPPHIMVAPSTGDGPSYGGGWQTVCDGFPEVYAHGFAVRLQAKCNGTLLRIATVEEARKVKAVDIDIPF